MTPYFHGHCSITTENLQLLGPGQLKTLLLDFFSVGWPLGHYSFKKHGCKKCQSSLARISLFNKAQLVSSLISYILLLYSYI